MHVSVQIEVFSVPAKQWDIDIPRILQKGIAICQIQILKIFELTTSQLPGGWPPKPVRPVQASEKQDARGAEPSSNK